MAMVGSDMEQDQELQRLRGANEELERRLAEQIAAHEAATREFDSFVYSVSHDLRAPLRHISAFAGMLGRSAVEHLDERDRSSLEAIKEAADRMNHLLDDLLRLSRIARAEMNCTSVPLSDVIRQAQNDLAPDAHGRQIDWRISRMPIVYGDPTLLRHAFVELLANAIKFTRARDGARIEVAAKEEPERWIISVNDNGVGFDQKLAGRLFTAFQRLHSEREFEGTGMGLTIVRRIIARHHGETWAEGRLDEGATFFFTLPRN